MAPTVWHPPSQRTLCPWLSCTCPKEGLLYLQDEVNQIVTTNIRLKQVTQLGDCLYDALIHLKSNLGPDEINLGNRIEYKHVGSGSLGVRGRGAYIPGIS